MGEPQGESLWSAVASVLAQAPRSPAVLIAALMMTGLASSMVLAEEATSRVREVTADSVILPAGAFRSPHPAIIARGP